MALAAFMTRQKRDRRREMELGNKILDPAALAELTGKEAEEAMRAKAAHETIKKMLNGKELLRQKSKPSFDALSQVSYQDNDEDSSGKDGSSYSAIYIGLILICIGIVITFVGLGEKGFKTVQLKLIGPILCIIGLTCIVLKVIQCTFPNLFQYPTFFRRKNLGDKEVSSLMERGTRSQVPSVKRKPGSHVKDNKGESQSHNIDKEDKKDEKSHSNRKTQKDVPSPRVTLHSAKRPARPRSTIPNYIEASSDDDDFDAQRKWKGSDTMKHPSPMQTEGNDSPPAPIPTKTTTPTPNTIADDSTKSSPTPPAISSGESNAHITKQKKSEEIVLTPKGLFL